MGIRGLAIRSIMWLGTGLLARQVLDQVFAIALARILVPRDFGIIALASVFTGMFRLFMDLGLGAAIVHRRHVDDVYLSTAFWGNIGVGLLLAGGSVAAQGAISTIAREPMVGMVIIVLSIRLVLGGAEATQLAVLSRRLAFRTISWQNVVSVAIGGTVAVVLAVLGYGVWSLVGQALATSVADLGLLWRVTRWRPRLVFSWEKFKDLWGFGINVLGAKLVSFSLRNVDNLLVGRYLGAHMLGFYALAFNVLQLPVGDLNFTINRVAFAAASRAEGQLGKVKEAFLTATRFVALMALPLLSGMALVAPEFVEVLFGPKWAPAAPVISILMVGGIVQALTSFWSGILQAVGRPELYLRWSVLAFIVYIPAFVLGLKWGIIGVAWAYVIATYVLLPPFFRAVSGVLAVTVREYVEAVRTVVAGTGMMFFAVWLASLWLQAVGVSVPLRLAALIATGGIVYVATIWVLQRQILLSFTSMLRLAAAGGWGQEEALGQVSS